MDYKIVHFKNLFLGYAFYYNLPLTSDVDGIGVYARNRPITLYY